VFFLPPEENVAAQMQTMETYVAQGVTGSAIAPSDAEALEPVMREAARAGILVTTLSAGSNWSASTRRATPSTASRKA